MKLLSLLSVVSLSLCLSACVTGTRTLDRLEVPSYDAGKSASGEVYIRSIKDKRGFEQKPKSPSTPSVKGKLADKTPEQLAQMIGRQRNGYGKAMGDVALPEGQTVMTKMREILTEGLSSRGYTLTNNPEAAIVVDVDIEKFWAWFSPGFVSVSFETSMVCAIDIVAVDQTHDLVVDGYGINKGQMASNANWELVMRRATEDFLQKLDKQLDEKQL